jgi:hypothetical protein
MMGFAPGSSTISMKEINTIFSLREFPGQGTAFANEPNAYTLNDALAQLRSRIAAGNSNVIIIPPAMAAELREDGVATVEQLKVRLASASNFNFWPVVAGTDPGFHRTYTLDTAGNTTYATALIAKKGDPIAPSAPLNFTVEYSADRRSATIRWEPPARDGDAGGITAYEVSGVHGLSTVYSTIGTANFPTGIVSGMLGGGGSSQGMTRFRLPATAREYTFNNLEPDLQGFFMVRAFNGVRNNVEVQGMTNSATATYAPNAFNRREAGAGSWALYAEPPIDLGFGVGRSGVGLAREGFGTPRHYRAEHLDRVYVPGGIFTRAPATGSIGAATLPANIDALLDGVTGNAFTATRNGVGTANSVALTYAVRWFTAMRDNRMAHLEVTITSEDGDADAAFVFGHCPITNTTKAVNGAGFFGREEGSDAMRLVGTGAAGSWAVNTGAFNHANYGFFATEGGLYTITFVLRELTTGLAITTHSVNVTVNAPIEPIEPTALLLELVEDPEVENDEGDGEDDGDGDGEEPPEEVVE